MANNKNKLPRTGEHEFPALFTIENSSRHECKGKAWSAAAYGLLTDTHPLVLLVNPGIDLHDLTSQIERLIAKSPNAGEFMGKYRSKDISETVTEVTVKWAAEGRDSRVFVKETLLTEENIEPVLRMMAVGVGKDVFDVKVKVNEKKAEKADEKEKKVPERSSKR
jgi:hypothetical protein